MNELKVINFEHQQRLQDRLKTLYTDPDFISEAIGLDGVQHPDSVTSISDKRERDLAMVDYENSYLARIGNAIRHEDYYLLGMLIGQNAKKHIEDYAVEITS